VIAADANLAGAMETLALAGIDAKVHAAALEVRSLDSIRAVAAVTDERFGGLDVLINNAGIEILGTIEETAPETWDEIIAVNLRGPYLVSRQLLPAIRRRAGERGGGAIATTHP
jgi:NAD(P)-dependent dehydrogenase (short-subunit alcohol dehydrogenase family)